MAIIILAIFEPQMLEETLTLSLLEIISGVAGALIAYIFINSVIKKNKEASSNSELIDDSTFYSKKDSDF